MKITAYMDKTRTEHEIDLKKGATVADALQHLNVNPVTVLVARNDDIILEDEALSEGNHLKIISVISGG